MRVGPKVGEGPGDRGYFQAGPVHSCCYQRIPDEDLEWKIACLIPLLCLVLLGRVLERTLGTLLCACDF